MSFRLQPKIWLCAVALFFALECFGQGIRVTTWNLETATADGFSSNNVAEVAAALNKTSPDVVLLQNVPDWKTCDRMVEALKPAKYYILLCSSFREGTSNVLSRHQVAVLSKYRAYFSWSEPWRTEDSKPATGGFAFVGLRIANQPLGFYSVELPGDTSVSLELAADQLLAHARTVQGWEANKVDATTAAISSELNGASSKGGRDVLLRAMEEAGFGVAVREIAPETVGALSGDFALTEPPEIAGQPKTFSSEVFPHAAVTYDIELDPAKLLASRTAAKAAAKDRPQKLPARKMVAAVHTTQPAKAQAAVAAAPAAVSRAETHDSKRIIWFALAGVVVLAGVVWGFIRLTRRPALKEPKLLADSGGSSSYTIIVGTPSTTGVTTTRPARLAPPHPVIHMDSPQNTQTQAEMLRRRAEAAEERAQRAQEAIRSGIISNLSQWLKNKFVRRLITDRAQLMDTQHVATIKALAVEERLAKIEAQINIQNLGYQQRIEDLTKELIAAKEENRELIRAQIRQVKAEMEEARVRMLAQAKDQGSQ